MSELVEQRLEKLVPQLELLKHLKIYNEEEIKNIITKRKNFEYKIQRYETDKKHFTQYIDFETNILEDIRLRRLKYNVTGKKGEIEYAIIKRILQLYDKARERFPNDLDLWFQTITFATASKFNEHAAKVIDSMMQLHPKNADVWKAAAIWKAKYSSNSLVEVRKVLLKALQYNTDSEDLYYEVFYTELKLATDELAKSEHRFDKAMVVFNASMQQLPKIEFLCRLLNLTDEFDETGRLQTQIIDKLQATFNKNEYFWHVLAQRELEGKHFDQTKRNLKNIEFSETKKLENACHVYELGLEQIPTKLMWKYYIETILNCPHSDTKLQYSVLKQAYDLSKLLKHTFLTEDHYIRYVQLIENALEQQTTLTFAIEQYPRSVKLWVVLMSLYMSDDNKEVCTDRLERTFRQGCDALKEQALPLWKLIIEHYMYILLLTPNLFEKINNLYEQGISVCYDHVSEPLKIDYLKWLNNEKGLPAARAAFKKFCQLKSPSLDLINTLVELENQQVVPNRKYVAALLNLACTHYGETNISTWVNLLKHQLKYDHVQVSYTYENAKMKLQPEYRSELNRQYQLMKISGVEEL